VRLQEELLTKAVLSKKTIGTPRLPRRVTLPSAHSTLSSTSDSDSSSDHEDAQADDIATLIGRPPSPSACLHLLASHGGLKKGNVFSTAAIRPFTQQCTSRFSSGRSSPSMDGPRVEYDEEFAALSQTVRIVPSTPPPTPGEREAEDAFFATFASFAAAHAAKHGGGEHMPLVLNVPRLSPNVTMVRSPLPHPPSPDSVCEGTSVSV
jgi:hypothetical protein